MSFSLVNTGEDGVHRTAGLLGGDGCDHFLSQVFTFRS